MGRRWLTSSGGDGWIALKTSIARRSPLHCLVASTVIPVLVDGVSMPRAEEPEEECVAYGSSATTSDSGAPRSGPQTLDSGHSTVDRARRRPNRSTWMSAPSQPVSRKQQWLRTSVKILFVALVASIALLVVVEIIFGWTLDRPQISSSCSLCWASRYQLWLRSRCQKRKNSNAPD